MPHGSRILLAHEPRLTMLAMAERDGGEREETMARTAAPLIH